MKATTLLKKDHDAVKRIFRDYQQSGERAFKSRLRLFEKMKQELDVHAKIEEEIFYPAVKAARTEPAADEKRLRATYGDNFPRLVEIKKKYDPSGLFTVHNGVGSEEWSADGFTKL